MTTGPHGQAKRFVPHLSVAKVAGVVMSDWSWWKRSPQNIQKHQMMVEKHVFLPSIVVGGIQTPKKSKTYPSQHYAHFIFVECILYQYQILKKVRIYKIPLFWKDDDLPGYSASLLPFPLKTTTIFIPTFEPTGVWHGERTSAEFGRQRDLVWHEGLGICRECWRER